MDREAWRVAVHGVSKTQMTVRLNCTELKTEGTSILSSLIAQWVKSPPAKGGEPRSIPWLGRYFGEGIGYPPQYSWNCLVAWLVKNLPAMWETSVRSWVGKIPWRKEQLPTPVFWPGEVMDCIVHGITKSRTRLSKSHSLILSPQWLYQCTFFPTHPLLHTLCGIYCL